MLRLPATTVIALALVTAPTLAAPPAYQVFPQLNALAISYHVKSSELQSILYATNHESKPVLCDALMETSKQEKSRGKETLVEPGQTIPFTFRHRLSIEKISLFLICAPIDNKDSDEGADTGQQDDAPKSFQAGELAKPAPVVEESLDDL